MNDLIEFLETLKSIQSLPEPMQPAAVDRAVERYTQEVDEQERAMEAQHELFFADTVFAKDEPVEVDGYFEYPTPS